VANRDGRRNRVVAYDRAGIGGSDPEPDSAIVARQVSDLASLITDRPSIVADAIMQVVARVRI
jgi:pimeloyl-ACP methyl ester carboxylesterase